MLLNVRIVTLHSERFNHKGILEAIEKTDLEEMNKAIKYHLDQVKKDVLRYAFKEMAKQDS